MTFRLLKVFLAVCNYGTMSLAAEKLFIAQPTVSQAISDLEKHYGVLLFERLSKKLYLTEAGENLLSYARHMVALLDEMEEQMQTNGQTMRLRIGATVTVGTCLINPLLKLYENNSSHSNSRIFVENTHVIEQMLLRSELDVGIVEGELKSADILSYPIMWDHLVLLCSPTHPFAQYDTLPIEALHGQDFVMREKGSGTRALFEKALDNRHVVINEKWTCHNTEAIKNAILHDTCLAVISERLVEEELKSKQLHTIHLEDVHLKRSFDLVYHKNKYLSEALKNFITVCLEQLTV